MRSENEFKAWMELKDWWFTTIPTVVVEDKSKRQTAWHEAGHAVAYLALGGWDITKLSIESTRDQQGICSFVVVKQLSFEQEGISFLAGPLAELKTGQLFTHGIFDDWYNVMEIVKWIVEEEQEWDASWSSDRLLELTKPTFLRILDLTQKLIDRHSVAVEAIAQALLEHEELLPNQAKVLFESARRNDRGG